MIKETIAKIAARQDLTEKEAADAMSEIMSGEATEAQIAAFITGLRMKGETIEEITGCARIMRRFATPIRFKSSVDVDREDINIDRETFLDTCGTGGDGTCTFNVSTATALVIAACGLTVAKHGNRSVSSACGSADVLEALGVNLNVTPEKVEECLEKIGIGFLFAASLHGAMKYAIGPRKQIGIRTIFNILGPLTNPAGATAQVLGVYSGELLEPLANVLKNLGARRAWIVHGDDGVDEISITSSTRVAELKDGTVKTFTIRPEDFELKCGTMADIRGGNARQNAEIVRQVLAGQKGPRRDMVVLNAGAGLHVGEKVKDIRDGVRAAQEAIDTGRAAERLEQLVRMTNE